MQSAMMYSLSLAALLLAAARDAGFSGRLPRVSAAEFIIPIIFVPIAFIVPIVALAFDHPIIKHMSGKLARIYSRAVDGSFKYAAGASRVLLILVVAVITGLLGVQ
jgi:hypothetical protein